jgi:predicted PurR-regulated permease PerM
MAEWSGAMARVRDGSEWHLIYGALVLVVLGLFLFSLRAVLSPFVLFLLLLLLLAPYAGTRTHLLAVSSASLMVLIWLLETTGFLLAPFLLALAIAYILDPVVDLLERRGVPRALAIFLLFLPGVGVVAAAAIFGIPAMANQIASLVAAAPEAIDRIAGWFTNLRTWLLRLDIPGVREEAFREPLRQLDTTRLVAWIQGVTEPEALARRIWAAILGVGRGLGTAFSVLGYVVLTPVLGYYLLRDYDRITERVRELIPPRKRPTWTAFLAEYDTLLSRYLRGQLLTAAVVGVLTALLLWIVRFPYAGLVGAVAGVFNLVPYLGLVVSLVPALLIALLSGSVLVSLLKIAIVFAVVQILEGSVLSPRIVGGSVGLHPVWVILALAVGGFFLGLVGLLLAVPAAVLIKLLLRGALERYRRSAFYREAMPDRGA